MEHTALIGHRVETLDTPALTIDLDILERNIAGLQSYLTRHGIAARPHAKTHKIPAIAHMQLRAGAVGITCQKLGEAEVMADAGISDIFVPMNIVGEAKLTRLVVLARRVRLSVSTDDAEVALGLSRAAVAEGITLEVLVECD